MPSDDKGSLRAAHERITGLMDDLENTLELVKRLADTGDEEAALKLIDRQRAELYEVVGSLSSDVAASKPSWRETARRHVAVLAAASIATVSTLAASVAFLTRPPEGVRLAVAQIEGAEAIADPTERLTRIITVYRVVTETLPADQRDAVTDQVLDAIEKVKDDAVDDPDGQTLAEQADRAAKDIQEGRPPTPPNPPSTDEGPVETLQELLEP